MLDEAARSKLREIADAAVRAAAGADAPEVAPDGLSALDAPCGAFVTLKIGGKLRGCIGTIQASRPARETVREMAESAAVRDPRFPALAADEVDEVALEISLLSPLTRVEDVAEIEVGRHGLYVKQGQWTGLLLPQVPGDHGWDREEFLAKTCFKAGLTEDAWQDPETEIYRFEAEIF